MVFNATFNNISDISWRSVLLVEDPEKITDKVYHKILHTPSWSRFELTTSVVIDTDNIYNHLQIFSINPISSQSSETAYPVQSFHGFYRQFLFVIAQFKTIWPNKLKLDSV